MNSISRCGSSCGSLVSAHLEQDLEQLVLELDEDSHMVHVCVDFFCWFVLMEWVLVLIRLKHWKTGFLKKKLIFGALC